MARLRLLNGHSSRLAQQMGYYIAPEEPETNFLRLSRSEDTQP